MLVSEEFAEWAHQAESLGMHFKIRWVVVKQEALSQHALSIEAWPPTLSSALHF